MTPCSVVVAFAIDYFSYTEVPHFLDEIKNSQFSEKLTKSFLENLQKERLVKPENW